MSSNIGQWARRVRLPDRGATLWHYVESEIGDRLVTRCGRQMHHKRDLPFEFTPALFLGDLACKACTR